jgi:hypothetical protein
MVQHDSTPRGGATAGQAPDRYNRDGIQSVEISARWHFILQSSGQTNGVRFGRRSGNLSFPVKS